MKKIISIVAFIILLTTSCTEPYALQTDAFEDVIVIEATITNELKKQEIKISKSIPLEQTSPKFEAGATVYLKDNLGNQYNFSESNESYFSDAVFQAVPNTTYQLFVTTKLGKSYTSSPETLTTVSPLQEVVPEVVVKEGAKGVQIVAKSFDPTNTSKYYRYEYEETYKVIAPLWLNVRAKATPFNPLGEIIPGTIELIPRTEEARICYSSKKNTNIILSNTSQLSEDRVAFPIRFISNKDYIIMHRYSILVKQYVQNLASHTYYQTLKKISNTNNLLSQNQPGLIASNIKATSNINEKVLGYFSVNSYSEKRIFFNFQEIFTNDAFPKYPYYCPDPIPPPPPGLDLNPEYEFIYCFGRDCGGPKIFESILQKKSVYYSGYDLPGTWPYGGPLSPPPPKIIMYPIQCGDCTSFSNNIKPSFWID